MWKAMGFRLVDFLLLTFSLGIAPREPMMAVLLGISLNAIGHVKIGSDSWTKSGRGWLDARTAVRAAVVCFKVQRTAVTTPDLHNFPGDDGILRWGFLLLFLSADEAHHNEHDACE